MRHGIGRVIVGFLVAPILSPIIVSFQFGSLDWRLVGATFTIAYFAMGVFALPLFYLLHRRGWRRLWQFVGAGIAACCLFLLLDYIEAPRQVDYLFAWVMRFVIHAALASLVFWFVAVRQPAPNDRAAPAIQ